MSHYQSSREKESTKSFGKHFLIPVIAIILIISAFIFDSQFCYAVTIDGETVGTAKNVAEAETVVTQAEAEVSELLGYEYSLGENVEFSAMFSKSMTADELSDAILGTVDGLAELYILFVDDSPVGAHEDETVLLELLNTILDKYSNEDTVTANFVQDVVVRHDFVNENIPKNVDEIRALLDPENGESEFCLDVETIDVNERIEFIPHSTEYYTDDTIYDGDFLVVETGLDGKSSVAETRTFINGEQVGESVLSEMFLMDPVTEVIAIGTMERPPTASFGKYIWPCAGMISSHFGPRSANIGSASVHKGIDIAANYGIPIYAADGGEVIYSDTLSGFGKLIQIRHDNGDITYYGHCQQLLVPVGKRVAQGELIAYMGSTGVSSGPHCHFEIRPGGGEPVNPIPYLPEGGPQW